MQNNQQRQQCEFHTQLEFLMRRLPVMGIIVYWGKGCLKQITSGYFIYIYTYIYLYISFLGSECGKSIFAKY